jgi:hypothetical protein
MLNHGMEGIDVAKILRAGYEKQGKTLYLAEWYRQGNSYVDTATYEVLEGEIEIQKIKELDEGYPFRRITVFKITPKTEPVRITYERYDDYPEPFHLPTLRATLTYINGTWLVSKSKST